MGRRIGTESDDDDDDDTPKSLLVLQICSLSSSAISCLHNPSHSNSLRSHFIDWYRILGVAQEAEVEVVRKQYHKLALQLHPDKNKHPKADLAFKLISEAHSCLSDSSRRRTFDFERSKHFCTKCNKVPYTTTSSSSSDTAKLERSSRSFRAVQGLEDIRNRFREEVRVIENCLIRSSNLSRKESDLFEYSSSNNSNKKNNMIFRSRISKQVMSQKESPIFNPSDYLFHGYPHLRTQVFVKPPGRYCNLQRGLNDQQGGGRFQQSPVFQNSSDQKGMFRSKSVCVHS